MAWMWVRAGTGGISASEFPGPLSGRWWRLDAGCDYGALLLVWNDYAAHWSWEPIRTMRLVDYETALRATHPSFVRTEGDVMVDISPKALRFARLAAERHAAFASDPDMVVIRREEALSGQKPDRERVKRYVEISESTALFCVRAMTAMLEAPGQFGSYEWDGNDFMFMQTVTRSLRQQLTHLNARTL